MQSNTMSNPTGGMHELLHSQFLLRRRKSHTFFSSLFLLVCLLINIVNCEAKQSIVQGGDVVQLHVTNTEVVMDNGLVQVTLSNPVGIVTGIKYGGIDNLLEFRNKDDSRGYWDLYATQPGGKGAQNVIRATEFKVIVQNDKQVEVSFSVPYDPTKPKAVPLNLDKRFIMLQGDHGFYTYAIYEHKKEWPAFNLNGTRVAFKLDRERFRYMVVSDTRQRRMPMPEDRLPGRGEELQFKEAVRLLNPVDSTMKGEVDDKYQYVRHYEEIKVHGWASADPLVGFWQITPTAEFRSAGPYKQDLTSHVGPTSLTVFHSSHYMGQDQVGIFKENEPWKKVFGPVFIYLNSGPAGAKETVLWEDAKKQLDIQTKMWPYSFPASIDFPKANQRGAVQGKLLVRERTVNEKDDIPAKDAYIGLAVPGAVGSFQLDCKGYQFWTKTGPDGSFSIKNIREGEYNVYASVPGFISDYKNDKVITIKAGDDIDLGDLIYEPPRNGTTLWEIGVPDRSAEEFFIPDVDPLYSNPLYLKQDRYRQYGLWNQYYTLYPKSDVVYTVNSSDYKKDWFYAHVTRKVGEAGQETYNSTTWQIKFNLDSVDPKGSYTMRLAIASSTGAEVQVRFNDANLVLPHFTTKTLYKDNAIARHTIHGLYSLFNIDVKSSWLNKGNNTIFLTQARSGGPFQGVMYDYIRLEGPAATESSAPAPAPEADAPASSPAPAPGPGPEADTPAAGPESDTTPADGPEADNTTSTPPAGSEDSEPEPDQSQPKDTSTVTPPAGKKSGSSKLIYSSWAHSLICLVMLLFVH